MPHNDKKKKIRVSVSLAFSNHTTHIRLPKNKEVDIYEAVAKKLMKKGKWGIYSVLDIEELGMMNRSTDDNFYRCPQRVIVTKGDKFQVISRNVEKKGHGLSYTKDNELSWFDWSLLRSAEGRALAGYAARLFAARRRHRSVRFDAYPREPRVLAGDVPEVDWLDVDGEPMQHSGWDFAEGRLLGLRRAVETGQGELELSLLLVNGTDEARSFVATPRDAAWRVVIDSDRPDAPAAPLAGDSAEVGPHGVMLLVVEGYRPGRAEAETEAERK